MPAAPYLHINGLRFRDHPASISNSNSATTDVTGLTAGTYQFQLTVTDDKGATGTSTVTITVKAAANTPPTANAGLDQTITLPTNSVTLSGSGKDTDGSISSYKWTKISGSSSASISNSNSATTDVTGLTAGTYQFQLTVTDDKGATGVATVTVTVKAAANTPPTANAGSDQIITLPISIVTLSGSGKDADGSISSYKWTKISGSSSAIISNSNSATTDVTGLTAGTYQFQLTVTDDKGATGTSTVTVTVNAAANISPIADAGSDQTITLPTNSVTLSGSGKDADGSISSYKWTKISGSSSAIISNSNSATTDVTGLTAGTYQFQLTVTDDKGATGAATVTVTVKAAANMPPTANAGSDQTITLPTSSVTLSGSGKDADGIISSYNWTQVSGPSGETINNANSASANVTNLSRGVYQFELKVTDDKGSSAKDTVKITVNQPINFAPTANAGSNKSVNLPLDSIQLSGTGSDVDGIIKGYHWAKIFGPSGETISNADSASTTVTNLVQGMYKFELWVTDDKGATGTDVVQIRVNAANNVSPTSNAGPDKTILLPTNSVTLSGSGSDTDGTIVSYDWTKISGPSAVNIVNANSASTDITNLSEGVYQFELKVTDDKGDTGNDTVTVTVNKPANVAPSADAGSDKTITLPTNRVTLSGSGKDTDGTISSYEWSKISGPAASITNSDSASTDITGLSAGTYKFQLTVTDNNGATGTSTVTVTVNAAANINPTAIAGADQTVTLPTNNATLRGSGTDSDGTIVSYVWTNVSGPSGSKIWNPNSANTIVLGLVQGVYQFELQVTDNMGAIGKDTLQINVNAPDNIIPIANAGGDQTITLPIDSLTLSGSGKDKDGTIVSYAWTKISGPSLFTIVNPSSAITEIRGLVQGTYQFELEVTDNKGDIGTDMVGITVNPAANIPPTADAGSDQIITLPKNTVTLSGSAKDTDGLISSYKWTKISGPSSASISNSNSATTDVTGLTTGTYQFQLTVTDDKGGTGTSTVTITVKGNKAPPTAYAGNDQTITLPTSSITLSGSVTDTDGTIISYSWIKLAGPAGETISDPSAAYTTVNGLTEGNYTFEFSVTDDQGATGNDTIQVKVNPAINMPPKATAGSNQTIVLPADNVTLRGSGTDADGTIVSYLWTKISGPAGNEISKPNSANIVVSGLVQGVYQFELQVTDNKGAVGKDTVKVTVNASDNIAPTANAGADQTVMLPTNSVKLLGSGNDADGTIISYSWTKLSGPVGGIISDRNSANTNISGLVHGIYQFELKVTDDKGDVGTDTVNIQVNPAQNQSPIAHAGSSQTITLPTNSITLSGSGIDSDGTIASYKWTKKNGPLGETINSPSSAYTTANGLIQGDYTFELMVTDDQGASGTDTVHIRVNPAQNQSPTAYAGADQTITLPANSVTLTGSGTDADGTIASYKWTKISGPSSANISKSTSASTDVSGLIEGVYQFKLTATDNQGATGTSTVTITVKAASASNVPPVANAGSDKSITLPTNSILLSGSGTDADGTIKSYQWGKISGPSTFSIANPSSSTINVSGLIEGVYVFKLTVTDDKGATATSTVTVTVKAAANIPPTANAGSDQTITLPVNSVTLTGSGNDVDGTISFYAWTKISGPRWRNIK